MDEKLPDGWILAKLQDVVFPGDTRHPGRSPEPDFLYVDIEALDNHLQKIVAPKKIVSSEAPGRARLVIHENDIIFSLTRPYLKNIALVPPELDNQIASTAYCVMRPENGISSHFIFYLVSREDFISSIPTYGDSPPAAHDDEFLAMEVLIPPTNEQSRIVAAIEQQFTRLDSAVASLQSAKARVKQYRASLLTSAVEGELTKEWRVEHPVEEIGAQLLNRILVERRKRWEEAELAKMKEKPRDDKWKQKYKEPQEPDLEKLSVLPEGWCWATVEQIADVGTGATPLRSRGEYYNGGTIPWITSGSVNREFIVSAEEFITEKALAETNAKVFPIGSLILAMYGEGKTRGKISELKMEAATNQACAAIVFRPLSFVCQPYIKYFFMSNYLAIRSFAVGGVQPNLNLAVVKETVIPLPPLAEQVQIVAEVEASLSNIAKLEEATENNLKRAEHERQSILQEAFAGRLVLQDMNDEPASVLLERIREERKKREEAEKIVKASRKGDHVGSAKRPKVGRVASSQQNIGLYEKLVEAGQPLVPDDLFNRVGLRSDAQPESVEEFYEELHADVVAGLIEEGRPSADKVLLYAVEQNDDENLEEPFGNGVEASPGVRPVSDTEIVPPTGRTRGDAPTLEERHTIREEVSRRSLWDA